MVLPPLHAFRVFESVARLGNVSAAAAELHVTPGAVSQQIRALQTALGVDLFQKRGRQLALTRSGSQLQRSVASAMDAIQTGVRQLSVQRYGDAGRRTLTISIPQVHGVTWLATRLFTFMADIPNFQLKVVTSSHFPGVDWRKTDVAIVYGAPPWPGFWWRLLHGIRMTPVCSPQLLRGPNAIRQPSDLAYHRLLHEDDGSQWRRWQAEAGIAYAGEADVYFDDFGIVLQAARDGFGVALSDEVVSARDLDEGRLVQPLQLSVPALHNYYCICPEAKRETAEVSYFINWLIEEATTP
ncbi:MULTISPECIES: LysR substrate-binding domain-containing protein [unclassified Shinella]|uniref:LysR substrate-binding domain-containing protein n=1 Tax=unclassified Shinella TaxID=2643062 RepID=UPI00225D53DF|nr:LysR substrate-binding domain-containing protein [Shinella sp. YE25]MDC7258796.1 LysR family transcriptional regulator [Shinella sp. YE25]CAI0334429.1 Glycine cleavage system transcriptional activator [Rhizobiaceae bacterium]CAK7260609.1 LysR family transcriptional regulator, glycine cleavage system transcriptional activator [Shinella sp. WSC3-e]